MGPPWRGPATTGSGLLEKEVIMRMLVRLLSVAVVLVGANIATAIQAQTPLPNVAPKLPSLRWLDTLTVDPTPVVRNNLNAVTATLKLKRSPASTLEVRLELVGGSTRRGGMQGVECVWTSSSIHMEPGTDHESFPIYTGSRQISIGTPSTRVPKVITIAARYGSERVSTSFTVNCPQ
jgi:hypothetical protein